MDKPYLIEKTLKFSNIMEFFPLISFTEYIFLYKKKVYSSLHRLQNSPGGNSVYPLGTFGN